MSDRALPGALESSIDLHLQAFSQGSINIGLFVVVFVD